jgi:methyl coenzyme M reductase subunit D
MRIRLTKEEFEYVASVPFIPESLRNELVNVIQTHSQARARIGQVVVELAEESADTIRSLCEDQLDFAGFNIDYSLNSEGKILTDETVKV